MGAGFASRKTRQTTEIEPPFRFNRNGEGSGRSAKANAPQRRRGGVSVRGVTRSLIPELRHRLQLILGRIEDRRDRGYHFCSPRARTGLARLASPVDGRWSGRRTGSTSMKCVRVHRPISASPSAPRRSVRPCRESRRRRGPRCRPCWTCRRSTLQCPPIFSLASL